MPSNLASSLLSGHLEHLQIPLKSPLAHKHTHTEDKVAFSNFTWVHIRIALNVSNNVISNIEFSALVFIYLTAEVSYISK